MKACALKGNHDCFERLTRFFSLGGGWGLAFLALLLAFSAALSLRNAQLRDLCEEARLDLAARLEASDRARADLAAAQRELAELSSSALPGQDRHYLVISLSDRRLWLRKGGILLLTAPVAVGSGKTLAREDGDRPWKFDTPRGRHTVQSKEAKPFWAPPDWYYVEQAQKLKLGLVRLEPGRSLAAADGSLVRVAGTDVVRDYPDGRRMVLEASDGRDIVLDGKLLVPPLETRQRKFDEVLGSHRLKLGQGLALHGTNRPESVGRAVSHGCVRLLNRDIAKLYDLVPVGTPVYVY